MKTTTIFTVEIIEHDSWSGAKLVNTKRFKRKCDATRLINRVNGENTEQQAPDYYLTAHLKGESPWRFHR